MVPLAILPDGLLLDIASKLDARSLSNLARSHSRFGAVVRECLVRQAGVSPHQVPNLVTILDRHPTLAARTAKSNRIAADVVTTSGERPTIEL